MSGVIDISRGRRRTPSGWVHVPCPFCYQAGLGEDRGAHLGVHVDSGRINCFRCGVRGFPPQGYSIVGGEAAPVARPSAFAPLPFEALPPGKGEPVSPWPAGDPRDLGARWVSVQGRDAWALPFVGEVGYQLRYADTGRKINVGVRGPAVVKPSPSDQVVIVEGWGDALPWAENSVTIIALLGVENAFRVKFDREHEYMLALDMDTAGRRAQFHLTLARLRERDSVTWMSYPAKDPGSVDKCMATSWLVSRLSDAMELYNREKDDPRWR